MKTTTHCQVCIKASDQSLRTALGLSRYSKMRNESYAAGTPVEGMHYLAAQELGW